MRLGYIVGRYFLIDQHQGGQRGAWGLSPKVTPFLRRGEAKVHGCPSLFIIHIHVSVPSSTDTANSFYDMRQTTLKKRKFEIAMARGF